MKKCSKCKIEKLYTEFGKAKSTKDGYTFHCKLCRKQYCLDNAESRNQYDRQWRLDNPDHNKKYYKDNVEKLKQYRLDNVEYNREYFKQYGKSENGKLVRKSNDHKRRVLLKLNTPSGKNWTPSDIIDKMKLQHNKCVYCETSIKNYHEVDHIIPVVKGGSNESSNIQLLCKDCNRSKWSNPVYEFAQQHGKLF